MKIRIVDGVSSYLRTNITSNHISPRYSSLPSRHPSLSTHLMKHLSLHPRLRTGSADTILRAIEELTCKNTAMNRGGDTFIFKPKLLIEGDFLILASKYDAFSSFYSFVLNLSLSLVFLCSTVRFFTAYPNAFICPMSTQIFFALVMAV